MKFISAKVLLILFLLISVSSCGTDRSQLVAQACEKVESAWKIYAVTYKEDLKTRNLTDGFTQRDQMAEIAKQYIPDASLLLKEAGYIFRDLSAKDSGFAEYSELAFQVAALDGFWWADSDEFGNRISKLYYFCGAG